MKTRLIASLTGLCSRLFRTTRFGQFDLNGDQFAISWDDITDDLWP